LANAKAKQLKYSLIMLNIFTNYLQDSGLK